MQTRGLPRGLCAKTVEPRMRGPSQVDPAQEVLGPGVLGVDWSKMSPPCWVPPALTGSGDGRLCLDAATLYRKPGPHPDPKGHSNLFRVPGPRVLVRLRR